MLEANIIKIQSINSQLRRSEITGSERSQFRSSGAYELRYSTQNEAVQWPAQLSPIASSLHLFALRVPKLTVLIYWQTPERELSEPSSGHPSWATLSQNWLCSTIKCSESSSGRLTAQNTTSQTKQHYRTATFLRRMFSWERQQEK